jgi:hypothetical protein
MLAPSPNPFQTVRAPTIGEPYYAHWQVDLCMNLTDQPSIGRPYDADWSH